MDEHPSLTLTFQSETEFGFRIVFMPKVRWFALCSSHPVVGDLQSAVARAKGRGLKTMTKKAPIWPA